ncbi:MAG: DMT family transporter [Hyphomicrobiales bacterium]
MSREQKREVARGYLLLLLSVPFGALFYLTIDTVFGRYAGVTEGQAILCAVLSGLVISLPFVTINPTLRRKFGYTIRRHKLAVAISAGIELATTWAWFYAFNLSSADIMAFLDQTTLVWAWILGIVFLRERFSSPMMLSIGIAVVGFTILSQIQGTYSYLSVALVTLAAFLAAVNSLVIKKFAPDIEGFLFATAVSIIFIVFHAAIVWGLGQLSLPPMPAVLLLAAAECCWLFSITCYNQAHRYLPIRTIGAAGLLEPVVVLAAVWLIGTSVVGTEKIVGAALIVVGLLAYSWIEISDPEH